MLSVTQHGQRLGQELLQCIRHVSCGGVLQPVHLIAPHLHVGVFQTADDGLDDFEVVAAAGDNDAVGAVIDGDFQINQRGAFRRIAGEREQRARLPFQARTGRV